jgi:hypothetical protein
MEPLDARQSTIAQIQAGDPAVCRSVAKWPLDDVAVEQELDRLGALTIRWPARPCASNLCRCPWCTASEWSSL